MFEIGIDTIHWDEKMIAFEQAWTGGMYRITQTKFKEFRLSVDDKTIDIYPFLVEAKKAAEIDKQKRALLS